MEDLPLPKMKSVFDQQPIGNTTKMTIDEYPPDFNPADLEVKAEPLPIAKRLASKVWKVKKQALQQLLRIVSAQNHKQFCQHEATIIKCMSDSNIQCQFISTRILNKYLQKEGSYEGDHKIVIKSVIQKLMTLEKEQIQNLSMEVLFWMMDHLYQQLLIIQLNEFLLNKNPKIVAASMKVLQILLNNYGNKKFNNFEMFFKHFKILAETAKPTAKPSTVEFFKELYKWTGDNCFTQYSLHAQVKDEVSKWAKTYQMQAMEIKRGLKKGQQGKKINPLDEVQQNDIPVDVLHHFDSRWVDKVIETQKWQQKKDHLEEFIKMTRVNVIVPRQTSHYVTLLKRLFAQNNINLLQCAFKIVKNLCKGLRKAFSTSCKSFLSYIYLKLKDNKAMIVDQTLATLKAMTFSITLEDMHEQIKAGLKDKSPQMRLNTLKLLKQLSSKKQAKTTKILKSLLENLITLTNDSASDVRDIALSVLCKIKQHYGIIFFEDKLESLPVKKVNQIRSTPTILTGTGDQKMGSKMEIQEPSMSYNMQKSNVLNQAPNKGNPSLANMNKSNKPTITKKNSVPEIKPSSKNNPKPQMFQKKISQNYENQQKNNSLKSLNRPEIYGQNSHQISPEQQMMNVRNQEWPITPSPAHVLRLMNLFAKLGQPFPTLATPFKLKIHHFQMLENCDNHFMIENADLLLKWALWRVQIQDSQNSQRIISVVLHLIFLLKNGISDTQTFLVMSILSNSLQTNFPKIDLLVCANSSILEISQLMRQKMFNFWISTIQQCNNNPQLCQKILTLLKITYHKFTFNNSEIVSMARVQFIVRNRKFVQFLLRTCNREFLKVSGFKFQEERNPFANDSQCKMFLKLEGPQFFINTKTEQKSFYFEIFRKCSNEAMDEIRRLEQAYPLSQVMGLHVKIMDTIMLPYLNFSIQSINMYNYFKLLTLKITTLCDVRNQNGEFIKPFLRNLIRLLMFFMLDLNESKIDNKDEMVRSVNKVLLILFDSMPAEHLLEVMTMLLKHFAENDKCTRLKQLLLKCIMKISKSISFRSKSQKNVKMLFNFFISLIQQSRICEQEQNVKIIKSLFYELLSNFRQLCLQMAIDKLRQHNGEFRSKEIESLLKNFVADISNRHREDNPETDKGMNGHQLQKQQENAHKIDIKVIENYQVMSNLPLNNSIDQNKNNQMDHKSSGIARQANQYSNTKIREATNTYPNNANHIKLESGLNKDNNLGVDGANDLILVNQNGQNSMRPNPLERRRLKNIQQLTQSLDEITRLRDNGFNLNSLGTKQIRAVQEKSQLSDKA